MPGTFSRFVLSPSNANARAAGTRQVLVLLDERLRLAVVISSISVIGLYSFGLFYFRSEFYSLILFCGENVPTPHNIPDTGVLWVLRRGISTHAWVKSHVDCVSNLTNEPGLSYPGVVTCTS
jgi:hypothetical protein